MADTESANQGRPVKPESQIGIFPLVHSESSDWNYWGHSCSHQIHDSYIQSDHIIFTEMVNLFCFHSYRIDQKKKVIWKSFHFVIHPIIICTGYLYNWTRKQYTFHYARYCVLSSSVWYVCNPSLKLQEEIERTPPLCIIMPHTAQLDHTSDNITRLEVEA